MNKDLEYSDREASDEDVPLYVTTKCGEASNDQDLGHPDKDAMGEPRYKEGHRQGHDMPNSVDTMPVDEDTPSNMAWRTSDEHRDYLKPQCDAGEHGGAEFGSAGQVLEHEQHFEPLALPSQVWPDPLQPADWRPPLQGGEREVHYHRFCRFQESGLAYEQWLQDWFPGEEPDLMQEFSKYLTQQERLPPEECRKQGANAGPLPTATGLAARVRAEVDYQFDTNQVHRRTTAHVSTGWLRWPPL